MTDTIKSIVDGYLCTQCGTCVAVCPVNAIEMKETTSGLLTPFILEEKCIACGKCIKFCPGAIFDVDLAESIDPFKGEVYASYIGHAFDESIRARGQSGGIVSALLLFLLETGQIDTALVTTMPYDGSLRPKAIFARTRQEILTAQGSKYCPVATNAILGDVSSYDKIAVVALSCQMQGIHKLIINDSHLAKLIKYRIGLFCDRTLLYSSIDQMAFYARIKLEDITGVEYRSKARTAWPNSEVCFHMSSGETKYFPSALRTRLKDYFTPPRCRLCFDKMNAFCDVSVGDPWGINDIPEASSAIIARNKNGISLLKDAESKGYLELKDIDAEQIFSGQGVENRRLNFSAYMKSCSKIGQHIPVYKGLKPYYLATIDAATNVTCKRKLSLNKKIACSTSRNKLFRIVRYHILHTRIKSFVLRLIRKVLYTSSLIPKVVDIFEKRL